MRSIISFSEQSNHRMGRLLEPEAVYRKHDWGSKGKRFSGENNKYQCVSQSFCDLFKDR